MAGLKRFQPILTSARARDVNESDTVVIVTDVLQDIFGYDKYSETTSEHAIRGTFCDLAIKIDGTLEILIEVKAVDLDLKDSFVKQAVDYAANQGVDWVVLTNGVIWRIYKVTFAKPIDHELVLELNLLELNHRNVQHVEMIAMLAKEGWQKARLGDYHAQKQALSRFCLGALILSDPILDVIRRELRRVSPGIKVENEQIKNVLLQEVIKRDVIEGDKAELARKQINRAANRALRTKAAKDAASSESVPTNGEEAEVDPLPCDSE